MVRLLGSVNREYILTFQFAVEVREQIAQYTVSLGEPDNLRPMVVTSNWKTWWKGRDCYSSTPSGFSRVHGGKYTLNNAIIINSTSLKLNSIVIQSKRS